MTSSNGSEKHAPPPLNRVFPNKRPILGVEVSITNYTQAVECIVRAARAGHGGAVTALAVHGLMCGHQDPELKRMLNRFELVVPDGQPVRWALNWLWNANLPERVYGPELMLRTCGAASEERLGVYLYGSSPLVNENLRHNLKENYPSLQIVGGQPSRFRRATPEEDDADVRSITESGAHIVFVGLGCPRQERWAYHHREKLRAVLICVGAAFDFHAGTLRQAPPWMQKWGLEWLYRFSREPRRLWRRYLLLNPAYLSLLLVDLMKKRLRFSARSD